MLQDRIEWLQGGQEGMRSEPRNENQIEKERVACRVQSYPASGGVRVQGKQMSGRDSVLENTGGVLLWLHINQHNYILKPC